MGYIIPPAFSRITFSYRASNASGSLPSWGVGCEGAPDGDILAGLVDWYYDNMQGASTSDSYCESVEMRNDEIALVAPVNAVGVSTGASAPPNLAALIKLESGRVGRSNRGRIYWPGVLTDENVTPTGAMTTALQEGLQEVWVSLVDYLAEDERGIVILHSAVGDPTPVVYSNVQSLCATQRRRLRA